MKETNRYIANICLLLLTFTAFTLIIINIYKLMNEKDKQLELLENQNTELSLEVASMSDALDEVDAELATLTDTVYLIKEEIKEEKEETVAEEQIIEVDTLEEITEEPSTEEILEDTSSSIQTSNVVSAAIRTEDEIYEYEDTGALVDDPSVDIIEFEETPTVSEPQEYHLTKSAGVFSGPSGKETYYNLDMSGVISIMRSMGYSEDDYPYWVRDDGCKMFGDYIMIAANLSIRPKGTLVETSLGTGIVCDTGGFAYSNPTQIDIAVTW